MTSSGEGGGPPHGAVVAVLRLRAARERRRAQRAESLAADYEGRIEGSPGQLRDLWIRMAALQRRLETRHATSAALHELHAGRLEVWLTAGRKPSTPPGLMSTAVAMLGVPSATVAVRLPSSAPAPDRRAPRQRHAVVMASSSDAVASAAHDLELVLGEGPGLAAMDEAAAVSAGSPGLISRWPLFGPAVAELGVRSVHAVPLRNSAVCVGTLCVYGQEPEPRDAVATAAGRIAEAVTRTVLLSEEDLATGDWLPVGPLFDEPDYQPDVRQAVGMVAVQCGCGIGDAEDLLRACAFAEGRSVSDVAAAILGGELRME